MTGFHLCGWVRKRLASLLLFLESQVHVKSQITPLIQSACKTHIPFAELCCRFSGKSDFGVLPAVCGMHLVLHLFCIKQSLEESKRRFSI